MTEPPTSSSTSTKVQLTLYATKLKNVAGAFKGTSDPYAVVTRVASDPKDKPQVLGKTEVIKNSLNPRWTKAFTLDYELGKPCRLNIGVYDEVRKAKQNKPMGSTMFEVGEIVGTKGNVKAKTLRNGGVVYARIENVHPEAMGGTEGTAGAGTTPPKFNLQMRGVKLKNVDGLFGKSDPFFEISRQIKEGQSFNWIPMYRSKPIMNNLNPVWDSISLDMYQLCQNSNSQPILITVWDWDKKGKHTNMGSFETTVQGLQQAVMTGGNLGKNKNIDTSKGFELIRRGKKFGHVVITHASITGSTPSPPNTHNTAAAAATATAPAVVPQPPTAAMSTMNISSATTPLPPPIPVPVPPLPQTTTKSKPNFIEYISGGCELQMCVAIDFTGSNGDPRRPGTLHYIHKQSGELNDYEKALTAVGSIVARYDSDQQFPVWGFGAKFGGVIQHCFQVGRHAEAQGLGAIVEAYRSTFQLPLVMSGPTVFTEVIQLAAAQARSKQEAAARIGQQAYSILLILTDGAVSDVNATRAAIQAASDAPLSIVIVGIGTADFSAMQFLDDFQVAGAAGGGGRDICQFVELNQHLHNKIALTQATLDEIPDQLVDYFYSKNIRPLPEIRGSTMNIVPDAYNQDEDVDLTVDINDEGEISLANDGQQQGALYYNDASYGNINTYAGNVTVLPPPSAPPSGPYNPNNNMNGSSAYAPSYKQPQPQYQQPPSYSQPPPPQRPPVQASVVVPPPQRVFHVQLPPGVSTGMQIQVQNPTTQQMMIVTVPQGVPPGGTFGVPY